jgi:hypothetical protein
MENIAGWGLGFYGINATIYHFATNISNVIGQSIFYGRALNFGFTFDYTITAQKAATVECAGFYTTSDPTTVNYGGSLLDNNAQVLCSNGSYFGLGRMGNVVSAIGWRQDWTVNIDLLTLSFNITNAAGAGYFGFIGDITQTYYSYMYFGAGYIITNPGLTITDTAYVKKVSPLYTKTTFPFYWINTTYDSTALRTISIVALLQSNAEGVHNMFGQSISNAKIIAYSWTFLQVESYACVGVIESSNIAAVSLTSDVRSQSIAICTDNTKYGLTAGTDVTVSSGQSWTLRIDYFNNHINFTQNGTGTGRGFYSASFNSNANTYYTAQFNGYGAVQFGGSLTYVILYD